MLKQFQDIAQKSMRAKEEWLNENCKEIVRMCISGEADMNKK